MTEDDIKELRRDPDGLHTYEYLANHIGECEPSDIELLIDNMERVDLSGQFMASAARYLNAIVVFSPSRQNCFRMLFPAEIPG